jgi:formate dehydrogenase assembly factor FdhD
MKFDEIVENSIIDAGEYLFHTPSQQIVLCGGYVKTEGIIKALLKGRYLEDGVENFKKIQLTPKERKERRKSRCKGCGKK